MENKLSSSKVLKWCAIIGAILFTLPSIYLAIFYPVRGSGFYIKGFLTGIFLFGIWYSFRLAEKGSQKVPESSRED